jgi:proline dehydrogenase
MLRNTPVSFEDTSVAFSSKSDKELRRMHLLFSAMGREFLTKIGTFFVKTALNLKFPVKSVIKKRVFKQFCGGETIEECQPTISALSNFKIHTILDYAVEGEDNELGYDKCMDKVLETIDLDAKSEEISFSVFKVTGLAPFILLEKIQNGEPLTSKENLEFEKVKKRIDTICETAFKRDVRIMVDAEESWIQGTIDALVIDMMRKYNKQKAIVYNTFQMYRSDMPYNLDKALEIAQFEKFILGVKLVRGAYMEKERSRAMEKNYSPPIFPTKEETDVAFDNGLKFCVQNANRISLCCGSHNEKSNYYLISQMEKNNMAANDPRIWFSQLYGMSDHISYNLAAAGFNVAKYVPFGPVESVMPYLIRRAHENKAVTGGGREIEMLEKEIKRRKGVVKSLL